MITFFDVSFHSCEWSPNTAYGLGINRDGMNIITRVEGSQPKLYSVHLLSLFLTTKYVNGHSDGRSTRFYLKIIADTNPERDWMSSSFGFDFSEMCSNWWYLLPHPSTEHRGALHVLELCEMLPGCKQLKQFGAPLRFISISHLSSGVVNRAVGHLDVSWHFAHKPHFIFF